MRRLLLALVLAPIACSKPTATAEPATSAAPAPTVTASAAPPEDPRDAIKRVATFAEAVAATKPKMGDGDGEPVEGAVLLASWASGKMLWTDAAPKMDETSIELVRKDSDEERGKRMCVEGVLVSISKAIKVPKVYTALLMAPKNNVLSLYAARSTGDLVEHKAARFCGAVIGNYSYANSAGGTTHAVQMVGMFDLPENRLLR